MKKKKLMFFIVFLSVFLLILITTISCSLFNRTTDLTDNNFTFFYKVSNFLQNTFISVKSFLTNIFNSIGKFFSNVFKSIFKKQFTIKKDINKNSSKNNSNLKLNPIGKKIDSEKLNKDFIIGLRYFQYILKFSYFEALHNFIDAQSVKDFVDIEVNYSNKPLKVFNDIEHNVFYSFIYYNGQIFIYLKNDNLERFYKIKKQYLDEIKSFGYNLFSGSKLKNNIFHYYFSYELDKFNNKVLLVKSYKRFTTLEIILFIILFVFILVVLIFFDRFYSLYLEYKANSKTNKKLEKKGKIIDNYIDEKKEGKKKDLKKHDSFEEKLDDNLEDEILNL